MKKTLPVLIFLFAIFISPFCLTATEEFPLEFSMSSLDNNESDSTKDDSVDYDTDPEEVDEIIQEDAAQDNIDLEDNVDLEDFLIVKNQNPKKKPVTQQKHIERNKVSKEKPKISFSQKVQAIIYKKGIRTLEWMDDNQLIVLAASAAGIATGYGWYTGKIDTFLSRFKENKTLTQEKETVTKKLGEMTAKYNKKDVANKKIKADLKTNLTAKEEAIKNKLKVELIDDTEKKLKKQNEDERTYSSTLNAKIKTLETEKDDAKKDFERKIAAETAIATRYKEKWEHATRRIARYKENWFWNATWNDRFFGEFEDPAELDFDPAELDFDPTKPNSPDQKQ